MVYPSSKWFLSQRSIGMRGREQRLSQSFNLPLNTRQRSDQGRKRVNQGGKEARRGRVGQPTPMNKFGDDHGPNSIEYFFKNKWNEAILCICLSWLAWWEVELRKNPEHGSQQASFHNLFFPRMTHWTDTWRVSLHARMQGGAHWKGTSVRYGEEGGRSAPTARKPFPEPKTTSMFMGQENFSLQL